MSASQPVFETQLDGITEHRRGKVRDMYELDDLLLMVATDRISAYDLVLGSAIPNKGKVLTQLSSFWFSQTSHIVANHMISIDTSEYPAPLQQHRDVIKGRSMLVRKTKPITIECVARGYLSGSGWKEYQGNGQVCGVSLPTGLKESDKLPEPIFTPATRAETGHDINISEDQAGELIGKELVSELRELTLALYSYGAKHAESRGIIVADTKFEFGLINKSGQNEIVLIDEVLTPDSSRFWPENQYKPGGSQPSFDKQYVRDYLDAINWDRNPPVPELPDDVIAKTEAKYIEAYELMTGRQLA